MHLTSTANPRVKALAKLAEKKYREQDGLFLLEGETFVAQAAAAGWQVATLLHEEGTAPSIPAEETIATTPAVLSKISGKPNPQPVVAAVRQRWANLPEQTEGLWLALDRPRDPGNLGTILRTAEAACVAGVILISEATDPYAPECVRASMGSLLHVPLVRAEEEDFLAWANGKQVVGAHLQATENYRSIHTADVVLMGNESEGLTPALAAACTQRVRIPMGGQVESLNLATATALMLYSLQEADLV